jgi:hypothetical protein
MKRCLAGSASRRYGIAALMTVLPPDARPEHAQVVVDLGDGPDGRARIVARRLLLDRDRRRQAADVIDSRLLHLPEELPRVGGERLDVAALALRVERVEGQARLAGARGPREDHQTLLRDLRVDPLQVVLGGPADFDELQRRRHRRG